MSRLSGRSNLVLVQSCRFIVQDKGHFWSRSMEVLNIRKLQVEDLSFCCDKNRVSKDEMRNETAVNEGNMARRNIQRSRVEEQLNEAHNLVHQNVEGNVDREQEHSCPKSTEGSGENQPTNTRTTHRQGSPIMGTIHQRHIQGRHAQGRQNEEQHGITHDNDYQSTNTIEKTRQVVRIEYKEEEVDHLQSDPTMHQANGDNAAAGRQGEKDTVNMERSGGSQTVQQSTGSETPVQQNV